MDSSSSTIAASFTSTSHASLAEAESKFLTRTRLLHFLRLGLATLLFCLAIPAIACEAVALHHYRQTARYSQIWLYLWPLNLDLRPAKALLACGSVIAFQNLVYIITALLPSPHSHIRRLNLLAATTALTGFITALVGFVFVIYRPGANAGGDEFHDTETLHSWTCKWKATSSSNTAPAHFARDCTVTHVSFVLLGLLLGLEVVMGLVATAGMWLERSVARQRGVEEKHQQQSSLEMVGMVDTKVDRYPGT
ncbi:uncharacterized protein BP01DRAFT_76374 [Aspergillus saccharolyticus JOP 1030-1]|uniref:Uncharacterized protein n=1 Tax=Aspergillus saccharolyticus JOP 1030-1 TaxID=1450539 RepID=A0A319ACM6_9EURO|nr:hypothetical protein BP01DRAFT_76374 [Aspergillus saccharolyticus JOP 1030-1]PYH49398.1 hypothetical protein BP01DRAFT_76374 [Aspergillus saccharolyticus JOP 1030-1]